MLNTAVVTNSTCLTMSNQGPLNSSWKRARCTPVVSRSLEHHSGDGIFCLGCTPILRGGQRPPTSFPRPPTSRDDMRLGGYLEYLHAAKEITIYTHPCLLRDSNPGPTAQRRYTGWPTYAKS
ncbi:uncharacterized protein TNCV_461061 [Trichonephila clavipes]|nr:uncharacterized protein TNCV_461061 [Trichonephila clavipes]